MRNRSEARARAGGRPPSTRHPGLHRRWFPCSWDLALACRRATTRPLKTRGTPGSGSRNSPRNQSLPEHMLTALRLGREDADVLASLTPLWQTLIGAGAGIAGGAVGASVTYRLSLGRLR